MYDDEDLDVDSLAKEIDGWDNSQVSDCDTENYQSADVSAAMQCDRFERTHDGRVAWPIQRLEDEYIRLAKQHIDDHHHSHFETLRGIFRAIEICHKRVVEIEQRKREFLNKQSDAAA